MGLRTWHPSTQTTQASSFLNTQTVPAVLRFFPKGRNINDKQTQGQIRETPKPRKVATFVDRWYYTGMAAYMFALSLAAFLPAIFHPATRRAPISFLAAFHGTAVFIWLGQVLLLESLVATGRRTLHRKLGRMSIILIPTIIVLAVMTNTALIQRGFDLSGDLRVDSVSSAPDFLDPIAFSILSLTTIFGFGALAATAIVAAFYRRLDVHKPFMLFANILLVTATIPHLGAQFSYPAWLPGAVVVPLILSLPFKDYIVTKRTKALSWLLMVGMLGFVNWQLYMTNSKTQTWLHHLIRRVFVADSNSTENRSTTAHAKPGIGIAALGLVLGHLSGDMWIQWMGAGLLVLMGVRPLLKNFRNPFNRPPSPPSPDRPMNAFRALARSA
jgi:hypothetical protein